MPSIELERLSGDTHVIRGPTNIGVYAPSGEGATLIDSGNDDDAGRKILRACEAAGLKIARIANTHSNADHCGGNAFIQARTACAVASTRAEAAFIEAPALEPTLLWGGYPLPPLRNKFLMAKGSKVTELLEPPCALAGTGIEVVALPGHYVGMVGYKTPDGVLFAADAAASPEILEKYRYYYVYDVAAHLATLRSLADHGAEWTVPSHAEPTRDPASLAASNIAKVEEVGEMILDLCGTESTAEALVARLADRLGLELNHTQYALLGSTLRSYLAWFADRALVVSRIESNRLLFSRKG
jgi:glyoxylase-like metal-dependent hydrolase (beta-lactamase superfamily II)